MFIAMVFLLQNMINMVDKFRGFYLITLLGLPAGSVAMINGVTTFVPAVLALFFTLYVDRPPKPGQSKFKRIAFFWAIPFAAVSVLMFWLPGPLAHLVGIQMIVYQCVIQIVQQAAQYFCGTSRHIALVITPNIKEQEKVITYREIGTAIGASAPLVVVLVMGMIMPTGTIAQETLMFMVSTIICAVGVALALMIGSRVVQERITYAPKTGTEKPFDGYLDVLRNPSARLIMISEFVREFRGIASFMAVFLAESLLGGADQALLFGLPTGIGTAVGMLLVKEVFLKRFNNKQVFLGSGTYSILINIGAFAAGVLAFRNEGVLVFQVIFVVFLFLIGLQFGASNLLPSLFQSDILEDIEVTTQKRLEATLAISMSTSQLFSRTISRTIAPLLLTGFIGYQQPVYINGTRMAVTQTYSTRIRLLGVFTLVQGAFQLLGALPFIFYKLTGENRERIHAQAVALRAQLQQTKEEFESQA